MDAKELFRRAVAQIDPCIRQVKTEQLTNETPCSDWDLKALLKHLVYELLWVPELIDGKTVAEVGDRFDGDVLGNDIQAAWDRASHAALAAVEIADLNKQAHLSYGDVPMANYIKEIAGDVLIHGWDVDQSIKCNLIFDPEIVQALYDEILPRKEEYASSGLFGKSLEVPEDATLQTKLLALVGRKAG